MIWKWFQSLQLLLLLLVVVVVVVVVVVLVDRCIQRLGGET